MTGSRRTGARSISMRVVNVEAGVVYVQHLQGVHSFAVASQPLRLCGNFIVVRSLLIRRYSFPLPSNIDRSCPPFGNSLTLISKLETEL